MSYQSLSYLFLSSAAVLLVTAAEASAQTCTTAPSCSELGYTKSASQCSGKTMLYCPFDKTKVFCEDGSSCDSLGFTDIVSECPGSYVKCPTDATKGKCDFEASPGDLKYSLRTSDHNGWLLCNGRVYDKDKYPELYSAISGSFGSNLPNYSGYFLKAAAYSYASSFKTAQQAGLPNITAYGPAMDDQTQNPGLGGAFYKYTTSYAYDAKSELSGAGWRLGFDASKSNSIYGRSSTVTPQNYSANVFIYAGRKKSSAPSSCSAGNFFYSDGSCSSTYTSSKTLLGMVNTVYNNSDYMTITYVWGGNKTAANRTAADAACQSQGGSSAYTACDQHVENFTSVSIPSNSVVVSPNSSTKKYVLCFNENSYFTCNSSGCTRGGSNYTGTKYYFCYKSVNLYK